MKSKIIIDGKTIYYEQLFVKKSFPINEIAWIIKGRKSTIHSYTIDFYVKDKSRKDVLIFPESLLQKDDLEHFSKTINDINPNANVNLFDEEFKL